MKYLLLTTLTFLLLYFPVFGQDNKHTPKIEITVKDGIFHVSGEVEQSSSRIKLYEVLNRVLGKDRFTQDVKGEYEQDSFPDIWIEQFESELIKIKDWKSGHFAYTPDLKKIADNVIKELHSIKVDQVGASEKVPLIDKSKKATLLFLYASWCPPCREQLRFLEQINKKYKTEGLDVIIIFVNEGVSLPNINKVIESGYDSEKESDSFQRHLLKIIKHDMRGVKISDIEIEKLTAVSNFIGLPQTLLVSDQKIINITKGAESAENELLQKAVESFFKSL